MARPMANDPPFATLNHFEGDSRTGESDFLRIGITASRDQDFFRPSASASSRLLASFRQLYLAPMRASASDAPCARERGAWLQPDQSLPGSKCVRRAGHRLDCKTATADVGKRVAAKEHQVGVALVDPERDFSSVVRISELHTSETLLVPLEIGERMVEPRRADPSRHLKIVFRVLHGFRADRKTALIGSQDRARAKSNYR